MDYKEVVGDLFKDTDSEARLQCISHDCRMGKGIAVEFRKRYPMMQGWLMVVIKGHTFVPSALLYKGDIIEGIPVINLITKKRAWDKPTMETLKKSLEVAKEVIIEHNIKRITAPIIGCGLDGLNWSRVSELIKETFKDTDVNITIYKLKE